MTKTEYWKARLAWAAQSLFAPWLANKALREENERLVEAIANPLLTGISIGNGTMEVGLQGGAAQLMAGMFIGMFEKYPDAKNYINVSFSSPIGPLLVTIQKQHGKSAHELLQEARFELARWERSRDAHGLADQLQHLHGIHHNTIGDADILAAARALRDSIPIQEAWEAAGGNPGIKADKKHLLATLRLLDKFCDEMDARS